MQECPSCLESYATDELIIPHCGESTHSACEDCTARWYKKQSHEPCMVCRVNKSHNSIKFYVSWFVLGFGFTLFCTWILFSNVFMYDMVMFIMSCIYFYLYHTFWDSMPTWRTWKYSMFGLLWGIGCINLGFSWLSENMMIIIIFISYHSFLFGGLVHISYFLAKLLELQYSTEQILLVQVVAVLVGMIGYMSQLHTAYICYSLEI